MHPLKDRGFQHPLASDITPRDLWQNRRQWMQAAAAAAKFAANRGRIDAVVNNAMLLKYEPLELVTEETLDRMTGTANSFSACSLL